MGNFPHQDEGHSQLRLKFTVRTLFVLLTVTAVSAACFGGLVNAAQQEMGDVLLFIPLTAAAPLALMVLIHYILKIGDWILRPNRSFQVQAKEEFGQASERKWD